MFPSPSVLIANYIFILVCVSVCACVHGIKMNIMCVSMHVKSRDQLQGFCFKFITLTNFYMGVLLFPPLVCLFSIHGFNDLELVQKG